MLLKNVKGIKNKNVDISKIINNNKILWEGKERLANGTYTFYANEFKHSDDGYEKNWFLNPFSQYQREYKRVTVTLNAQNVFHMIYSGSQDPDIQDANSATFASVPIDGLAVSIYGGSNNARLDSVTIRVS